ncbi:murein transglycosylase [Actinophytocola sp.]|uniref:murein transglycosylase n=1 Tax=Actinophytocola sp. TaxID=1872138 RepID=UPI003D6C5770
MAVPPNSLSTTLPESPPPGRRRRGFVGPILLVVALVAASVAIGIALHQPDGGPEPPAARPEFVVPHLKVAPGSAVPRDAAIAPGSPRNAPRPTTAAVRDWATTLAEKTQIPSRSLVAYAEAALAIRASTPSCRLSWATLAGVGRVESYHGEYNGSAVGDDGQLDPPVVGVRLDGSPGVQAVRDTDRGRLDGDRRWDRAVGAMQFLPETWARWGKRAVGDGKAPDPQNIDDAALTAAHYLCASGGNLSTAGGWWRAVLTYNGSVTYGQDVFSGAEAYAKAATTL